MHIPSKEIKAVPIGNAIDGWIEQERISSLTGNNAWLEAYPNFISQIARPFDDPDNLTAAKHNSHANRQRLWGEAMMQEPENDYFTARHIFNLLHQVSGTLRYIRVVRATSEASYLKLRTQRGTGIDTAGVVRIFVNESSRNGLVTAPIAEAAQLRALEMFDKKGKGLTMVHRYAADYFRLMKAAAAHDLKAVQASNVRTIAHSIVSAMGYRDGELARVPFLEPTSITNDPQIYYPFADL